MTAAAHRLEPLATWRRRFPPPEPRPWVTLSYAQSLDGALTHRRGAPMALSGPESLRLTHALRAAHEGILVGVDTVLADDPQLTVRLVEGPQPQPIVLDSRLRFPTRARLLAHPRGVWIATTPQRDTGRDRALEVRGARLLVMDADEAGRVDLRALLAALHREGIASLMVEGGARVLTSFLQQGLADAVVVTVCPYYLGGPRTPEAPLPQPLRLRETVCQVLGEDVVIWGRLK